MNKQIFRLCRRFYRLDALAEKVRGTYMNLAWCSVAAEIGEVLDRLTSLGIDIETYSYLDKQTPEGQSILKLS